jgi:acetyltransferase
MVQRMTQPDPGRELVLLALVIGAGQQMCVGEARCVAGDGPATVREIGVVVGDAWQGIGIGTAMLRSLARQAKAQGVEQLVGDAMWENVAMIELAKRLGCAVRIHPQDARLVQMMRDLRDVGNQGNERALVRGRTASTNWSP